MNMDDLPKNSDSNEVPAKPALNGQQLDKPAERSQTSLSTETSSSVDFSAIKSPSASLSPQPSAKRELILHNELVEVPNKLFQTEEFFRSIINKEAFYTLSESARTHLINNYLPQGMSSNMDDTLDFIFSKSPNVGFVPPLTNAYNKVEAGFYNRSHGSDCVQLRDFHKVLHNHFIRNHHMKLLRHLVKTRHQILENACKQGTADQIVPKRRASKRRPQKDEKLRKRSNKRVAMMLSKVNEIVGVDNAISSDESGSEDARVPLSMFKDAESTLYNENYVGCDLDLHQPTELPTIKGLLRQYKNLCEKNPECPSLDIEDITLEGVYDRVGISYQSEKNYAYCQFKKLDEEANTRHTDDQAIKLETNTQNWS